MHPLRTLLRLPHQCLRRGTELPVGATADEECVKDVPWDVFDALFIGRSTDWKLGPAAEALVREAKQRAKWVHFGRWTARRPLRAGLGRLARPTATAPPIFHVCSSRTLP